MPSAEDSFKYLTRKFEEPMGRILKSYDYGNSFLKTLYWRIVRDYLLSIRDPVCACGSKHLLDLHHKTYDHHGWEHLHLDDLIFQCMGCHKKEHSVAEIKIERVFKDLAFRKRGPDLLSSRTNPDYDSRGVAQEQINAEK